MREYMNSNTPVSIRDEYRTPPELFELLDREFEFGYDVAADHKNTLCESWFSELDDAFCSDWGRVNFCNPPYSNITPWVEKAIEQHHLGKTIVMLLPSDTSVKWFKTAYGSCNEVRFVSGRISFINAATGKPVSGNNKGTVIFVWRAYCTSHSVSLIDRP